VALKVRSVGSRALSTTVYLEGKLNNDTVAVLDKELDAIVKSPTTIVIFDLTDLEYISSVGLRSIFRTHKAMAARGGKALLVHPQPPVKKVLEIVNATDLAAVFTSTQELDRYLDAMQRKVSGGTS
jgi:anti-anti-sigma factor